MLVAAYAALNHGLQAAPASVSLTAPAGPITFGRAAEFTASVSPSTATGRVTFYDGVVVIGTADISAGKASLTTSLLAPGRKLIRAYYAGDTSFGPVTSATVPLTVVTLPQNGFGTGSTLSADTSPQSIAVGDFNGDGKADLAVASYFGSSVTIFLGNGDGTFKAGGKFVTDANRSSISIVAADFNGDGKTDLAVANNIRLSDAPGTVSVLIGNGDGTFKAAVNYTVGGAPWFLTSGDFNGDGFPDLVVVDSVAQGAMSVLLGTGDGTFSAAVAYLAGQYPHYAAIGDFNGDGHPDIVVANYQSSNVSVFMGRGDGTFLPAVALATGSNPSAVAVGDFNGDGIDDFVVADGGVVIYNIPGKANFGGSPGINIFLGRGDGTFIGTVAFPAGPGRWIPTSLTAVDCNGDGHTDLIVVEGDVGSVDVILGNGDGTFQAFEHYSSPLDSYSAVVGDFNGDGIPDLAVSSQVGNSITVMPGLPPGPLSQTIIFPTPSDMPFTSEYATLSATASSGLPVTFTVNSPSVCFPYGGFVDFVSPGICSVTASQQGNTVYQPAPQITRSFRVNPGVNAGGVVQLYTSLSTIQAGSWISIYGSYLSETTATWQGDFPTSLGGVSVTVNGKLGYLWYVSPTQINLQAPDDTATGNVEVAVTNAYGTAKASVILAPASPAFSLLSDGRHVAGVILTPNGTGAYGGGSYDLVGPSGAFPFPTRPAKPGETLLLYGVGFGATDPPVPAGTPFSGAAPTVSPVAISINGVQASVAFSGIVSAGLYQFTLTVPTVRSGDNPVQATTGKAQTTAAALITIE